MDDIAVGDLLCVAVMALLSFAHPEAETRSRALASVAAGGAAALLHRCIQRRRTGVDAVRSPENRLARSPRCSPRDSLAVSGEAAGWKPLSTSSTALPDALSPLGHTPMGLAPAGVSTVCSDALSPQSAAHADTRRHARRHTGASTIDELPSAKAMTSNMSVRDMKLLSRRRRMAAMAPNLDQKQLVVVMVGMPGSGKSYTSQRIIRYARWRGIPATIFNAGNYRRQILGGDGAKQDASWFDPSNESAHRAKEEMARLCLDDLIAWLMKGRRGGGEQAMLGVFDATNSTRVRRDWVLQALAGGPGGQGLLPPDRVIFLELLSTDPQLMHKNAVSKLRNDDYRDCADHNAAIEDFQRRRSQYEKVYETIQMEREGHLTFIKNVNVGTDFTISNLRGDFPLSLVHFVMHLQTVAPPIYMTLSGDTDDRTAGRFGGDSSLNADGAAYADALRDYFVRNKDDILCEEMQYQTLNVWTSTEKSTLQTVKPLRAASWTKVSQWGCLDETNYGEWEGACEAELPPAMLKERDSDRFMFTYPRGESLYSLQLRLEPVVLELERTSQPLLIVVGREVSWCLLSYLTNRLPSECAELCNLLPANHVLKIDLNQKSDRMTSTVRLP
eukprot:TRINITY_DN15420_c0_g1_i1.p1 TRINITY_DN15420_c0_g1~~TRINITY_DN15420_c0_g1_i1.p1  ORF type:complete len:615 (+),score=166.38 TRINITY_DN15420_c0_g1_i1:65-1909(+)